MAGEWRESRLADVAEIVMGQSPPGSTYNETGDGLPFFQGVADFGSRYPSPRVFCTSPTRKARPGDILVSVRAPIGRVNIADRECAIGRGLAVIRARRESDSRFIELALRYMEPAWYAIEGSGSVFGNATKRDLELLLVPWPEELTERAAIAHILGTLDDKIELNRRMNETLEAMARTLFKSWFVDFDPVHAKAEGSQPTGIDVETAAFFPTSFKDSELGKIPTGWCVSTLGEHVEVMKGLSYKGSGLAYEGIPLHNLNSVYEGGRYKHEGLKHYNGEYKDRHVCLPGDVIVANTEQGFDYLLIGYPAIVPSCYGKFGLFTHHIYRVRPLRGSPLTNHFIYLLLLATNFREQVIGYTNGTTVNALSKDGLERPVFVLPPAELIKRFEQVVALIFDQQEILYEESRTLAALRDALLPKLISGDIRVTNAGRVVLTPANGVL